MAASQSPCLLIRTIQSNSLITSSATAHFRKLSIRRRLRGRLKRKWIAGTDRVRVLQMAVMENSSQHLAAESLAASTRIRRQLLEQHTHYQATELPMVKSQMIIRCSRCRLWRSNCLNQQIIAATCRAKTFLMHLVHHRTFSIQKERTISTLAAISILTS